MDKQHEQESRGYSRAQMSFRLKELIRKRRENALESAPQSQDEFWAELEAEQREDDAYRLNNELPSRAQEERARLVDGGEIRQLFGIHPDDLAQMEASGLIRSSDLSGCKLYSTADIEVVLRKGHKWNL